MNIRELDKQDQIERGKRIRNIRENELHLNKSQLAKKLGISSQFLGLVEDGRGNLVYGSIKRLKDVCGHSSDYILYGLDDNIVEKTNKLLTHYSYMEIINAIELLKEITIFIRKEG